MYLSKTTYFGFICIISRLQPVVLLIGIFVHRKYFMSIGCKTTVYPCSLQESLPATGQSLFVLFLPDY